MKILIAFTLSMLFTSFAPADICPICHSISSKTFPSKTENGKTFYKYECKNNHAVWKEEKSMFTEKNENKPTTNSSSCDCPVCGWHGYLTSTIGVKKCTKGHTFRCD